MNRRVLLVLPLFALALSSCTIVLSRNTEEQRVAAETLAAEIVQSTLAANAATQASILPTITNTPAPSPTETSIPPSETPTITPTPTADPNDPRLTLGVPDWTDFFIDDSYWSTYRDDRFVVEIEAEQLKLSMLQPLGYSLWTLAGLNLYDFYLEVQATTGPQCSGQDQYGLMFRAPDSNHGYQYTFSCDGKYRLTAWDGASITYIQNWTAHPAIAAGPGAVNRIGVRADGSTLGLYANGVLLISFSDDTYPSGGRFGLMVGAVSSQQFSVYYDNMAYWSLP